MVGNVLVADVVGFTKFGHETQVQIVSELCRSLAECPEVLAARTAGSVTVLDRGDGYALVFQGDPRCAARAALQLNQRWKTSGMPELRIGIHIGALQYRKGADEGQNVTGDAINLAQRVMDSCRPGRMLISAEFASILSSFETWKQHISQRRTILVKHGLEIEACELHVLPLPPHHRTRRVQRKVRIHLRKFGWLYLVISSASLGYLLRFLPEPGYSGSDGVRFDEPKPYKEHQR